MFTFGFRGFRIHLNQIQKDTPAIKESPAPIETTIIAMVLCSGVSSVVPPEFPPHLPGRHVVVLLASNNDPTQSDNKINVQKNFISSLFEVYLDHQCWLVDPRFGIHTKVSMVSKKLSDLVTKYLTGEKIKFTKICLRNSIRFLATKRKIPPLKIDLSQFWLTYHWTNYH